jgi:hypothetical protein
VTTICDEKSSCLRARLIAGAGMLVVLIRSNSEVREAGCFRSIAVLRA